MYKLISVVLLSLPFIVSAQESAVPAEATTVSFVGSYTLWIAIVVGFIASALVFTIANKMQGGLFGTALNLFGLGMLLVVFGFLAVVVKWHDTEAVVKMVHDVMFILGYLFMLLGAKKIMKATGGGA